MAWLGLVAAGAVLESLAGPLEVAVLPTRPPSIRGVVVLEAGVLAGRLPCVCGRRGEAGPVALARREDGLALGLDDVRPPP
jgi:hypothetical protein